MDEFVLPDSLFRNPYGIHGILHTKRVYLLAGILSDLNSLDSISKKILLTSALWHDIGRINDGVDDLHGYRSFEKVIKHKLHSKESLSVKELATIQFIIENHPLPDTEGLKNVSCYNIDANKAVQLYFIFKDADALDRWRIGDLNINFLRNKHSKTLLDFSKTLWENLK